MAYDTETVDISHIVQGGNPAVRVVGLIIQELDADKNVVFQWRSWDYFAITDATHENLDAADIHECHGNALEIENDNTILLSSRHLDEITKIDPATGNIDWRLAAKITNLHSQTILSVSATSIQSGELRTGILLCSITVITITRRFPEQLSMLSMSQKKQ